MRTLPTRSRFRRSAFVAALCVLLPLTALAQVTDGSSSNAGGSVPDGSTTGGSGSGGGSPTGSGTVIGDGTGTTSYDSPNTYNLGGATVSLATAIFNGGTVTNGTVDASTSFTAYSGSVSAQLMGTASLTKSTADTLILSGGATYSGGTTITEGTLQTNAGLTGNVANSASLVFGHTNDRTYSGTISGTGSVTQNSGILRLSAAQTYTGATTINGGYFVLPTTVDQGLSASTTVHVASDANFDLSNRATTIAGLTGDGTVYSFGGSSGHLTVNTAVGENQTFSGSLGGSYASFAFTKAGDGKLTLAGNATNSGNITVSAGTLVVDGSASASVNVSSGATLGGSGVFTGLASISAGAHLAPGNSPGTIRFASGLALASGTILDFELGTTSDLINVSGGTLTGPSSGTVTFNFSDSGGFGQATYHLFSFNGATLVDFDASDFSVGTAPSGWNYAFNLTSDYLDLVVTAGSAIPEPSTVALGLGLAGFVAVLVRRRRSVRA